MLRYGFFDSEIAGYDEEGMPIFDRAESSDFLAMFISRIISDGVLAIPGDCFQVVADEGMNLKVRPGFGVVRGRFAMDTNNFTITVPTAPSAYKRIDRVVLRANYKDRLCEIVVKEGIAAANPAPPELLRPAYGDFYELCLATVAVNSKQTIITQSNITDTRFDSNVCGLVTQVIDHLETSAFYAQFNQFYTEFTSELNTWYAELDEEKQEKIDKYSKAMESLMEKSESEFQTWFTEEVKTWFDNLKAGLSENELINLQNQIGNLGDLETEDKSSLTAAINEVKSSLTEEINESNSSLAKALKESNNSLTTAINEAKASGGVTGVKGQKESTYRKGNVNLTAENIGALPTTGGAMTGNIAYQGTKTAGDVIRFIDNTSNNYGNGVAIGAGSATIIGGGESINQIIPQVAVDDERMIIANDGSIEFFTNCQSGYDSAVQTYIDKYGKLAIKGITVEADDTTSDIYLVRRVGGVEQRRGRLHISNANNLGMWDSSNGKWVYIAPLNGTPRFFGEADTATSADNLNYFKCTSTVDVGLDSGDCNAIGYVLGTKDIFGQNDGAYYRQARDSKWIHEIYGDYRTGQIAVRGKNNGVFQQWRKIIDSSNYVDVIADTYLKLVESGIVSSNELVSIDTDNKIGILAVNESRYSGLYLITPTVDVFKLIVSSGTFAGSITKPNISSGMGTISYSRFTISASTYDIKYSFYKLIE